MNIGPLWAEFLYAGLMAPAFDAILAEYWPFYREYYDVRRDFVRRLMAGCLRLFLPRPVAERFMK